MMTSKRIFYAMLGVLGLLVVAVFGTTYLASQQLQRQSNKLVEYKTQAAVYTQEQTGLTKAKKDVATYSPLEKIAKTIVPQDKDQANAVRELVNIAAASGIKPTAITFPVSTLGSIISSGGTVTTPVAGSAASSGAKSLSQLIPVKGISGVYNLQIIIQEDATSAVPYSQFINFLSRLEQNRRTAQVTGIVLQPSALDHNLVSFTLTVDEFIKP